MLCSINDRLGAVAIAAGLDAHTAGGEDVEPLSGADLCEMMSDCLLLSEEQADVMDELMARRQEEMEAARHDLPREW